MVQTPALPSDPLAASDFLTGIVAELYRHLRAETLDPEPYARFVERSGEPALPLTTVRSLVPVLEPVERPIGAVVASARTGDYLARASRAAPADLLTCLHRD